MHIENPFLSVLQTQYHSSNNVPQANSQRKEIGDQAIWTLSSAKTGNGVDQLRDDNLNTFWQSDGTQPHYITIQFLKKMRVQDVALYLDFKQDESYTPNRLSIRAGTNISDMKEVQYIELKEPYGWFVFPLKTKLLNGQEKYYNYLIDHMYRLLTFRLSCCKINIVERTHTQDKLKFLDQEKNKTKVLVFLTSKLQIQPNMLQFVDYYKQCFLLFNAILQQRGKKLYRRAFHQNKKDDFDIFQHLKNERNSNPVSLHVTQIAKSVIDKKLPTQTSERSKQQIKKQRKNYLQLKQERYQKEIKEQQGNRRQELLSRVQSMVKKDLEDYSRMATKGVKEFEERCKLYSKYYSDELITPKGYRTEDMNLPIHKYSQIENQNKCRVILKPQQVSEPQLVPQKEFDQYQCNPKRATEISEFLQKLNIKLKVPNSNQQIFEAIYNNDEFTINKLLKDNPQLIDSRNRTQETPLHLACKRNLKGIVNILLKYHADESKKDLWGQTPRQVAFKYRNLELLQILSYK